KHSYNLPLVLLQYCARPLASMVHRLSVYKAQGALNHCDERLSEHQVDPVNLVFLLTNHSSHFLQHQHSCVRSLQQCLYEFIPCVLASVHPLHLMFVTCYTSTAAVSI